ncbi:MAG: hypothetical protein J6K71_01375 [Clostridia bacterium]|nr:hypothetical protein [Clostridia bacterium]
MSKFSSLWKKLKSIKNIEIILAVLLGLVVLLVYFSSVGANKGAVNNITYSNSYVQEIEQKLENLISSIDGAGQVEVMIMCEGDDEITKTQYPKVVSAVVVSSGADSTKVKLDIIRAVEALLGLKTANIEVLKGSG